MLQAFTAYSHRNSSGCVVTFEQPHMHSRQKKLQEMSRKQPAVYMRRAVKTIIAESCDAAGQAKAMGYMTSAMGVGSIAGPTIAGLLTRPCRHFASTLSVCEEGSLLHRRYCRANC